MDLAITSGWIGKKLELFDADDLVATVYPGLLGNDGTFQLDGADYRIDHIGRLVASYRLAFDTAEDDTEGEEPEDPESAIESLAEAENTGFFQASWAIRAEGFEGVLKRDLFPSSDFAFVAGEEVLGTFERRHFLSRSGRLALDPRIPRPIQVFLSWIVIHHWR